MRRILQAALTLALLAGTAEAQRRHTSDTFDRAFELERRGSLAAAADAFVEGLRDLPDDVNALLGLERVLTDLGRAGEAAPWASAALASDPENTVLYAMAVRSWTAAGARDSVLALVGRWSLLEPGSEAPFREWGFAALGGRDREGAREAYRTGRERLGRPDALAGEMAQVATLDQDWPTAVTEWLNAIRVLPGARGGALGMLGQVQPDRQGLIEVQLDRQDDPEAAGLAAALLARWGRPLEGQARLLRRLPRDAATIPLLLDFLEEIGPLPGRDAALARARTNEALADRAAGDAVRFLSDAARAYAEAGDQPAARRMLSRLSSGRSPAPDVARAAGVTLVGVLIAEGRLEEAASQLAALRATLPVDDVERLSQRLVRGLLRAGDLDRADALLVADSSVEGIALRGRAALFRGDLTGATRNLAMAGPYAADRADATERAGILALLQVVDADSLPALGAAFLTLERGDSAAAATGFERVASRLPPERGGAELLLLSGRLRADQGELGEAERVLRSIRDDTASAAAPAARLELARVLVRQRRVGEAVAELEQLILDHPASAVAPQARRLLDTVRGGVPGT